jgi:hypothetical protein
MKRLLFSEWNPAPTVGNIEMTNVTRRKSKYGLYLRGYKHAPIRDIRISHCSFENTSLPDVIENVEGPTVEPGS